jgi:hypothetical protein
MKRPQELLLATVVLASGLAWANQDSPRGGATQGGGDVLHKAKQSAVLVLVGDGGGTVHSVNTGIVIRSDGIVLTAYRPLKESQAVQMRSADGEVYDQIVQELEKARALEAAPLNDL